MLILKQSTNVTLKIGPFIDDTDGKTAEVGLTEHPADILLSKNGGAFAAKHEGSNCAHDTLGWYGCPIDDTDTATLGSLQLICHEAGFLPVFHEYTVVTANVYNSIIAGSDYLDVATAELANIDFSATQKTSLDTIGDTVITNGKAAIADSVWDEVVSAGTHDVADSSAIYLRNTYQSIVTRIAQATGGANGSVTLDLAASAVNDFYKGQVIAIVGGVGAGQARACYAYNGGTFVASVRPDWATPPVAGSWFSILNVGSTVVAAIEDIDFGATMKASINAECDTAITDSTIHTDVGTVIANLATVAGYVDTEVAAIKAVTDTLTLAAIADAVHDEVVDVNNPANANSFREVINVMSAALAGKSTGGGTVNIKFRDLGDTKDRINATVTAVGDRTAVTNDGT
jgi:hypothetical protein